VDAFLAPPDPPRPADLHCPGAPVSGVSAPPALPPDRGSGAFYDGGAPPILAPLRRRIRKALRIP